MTTALQQQLCLAGNKAKAVAGNNKVEVEISFGEFRKGRSGDRYFVPNNHEAQFEAIRQFFSSTGSQPQRSYTKIDELSQTVSHGDIREENYEGLYPFYVRKNKIWRYDFPDHDFRITIATEERVSYELYEIAVRSNPKALTRIRHRSSYVSLLNDSTFDGLRIDATIVTESSGGDSFDKKREVEMEWIGDLNDFNPGRIELAVMKLLSIKQNSNLVISSALKSKFISEHNSIFLHSLFEAELKHQIGLFHGSSKNGVRYTGPLQTLQIGAGRGVDKSTVPIEMWIGWLTKLKNEATEILNRKYGNRRIIEFKSKPVNLKREHFDRLFPYYITYKTDGDRQLLGFGKGMNDLIHLFGWSTFDDSLRMMQLTDPITNPIFAGLIFDGELVKSHPKARSNVIGPENCVYHTFDLLAVPVELMLELGFKYLESDTAPNSSLEYIDLLRKERKSSQSLISYMQSDRPLEHPFKSKGFKEIGGTGIRIRSRNVSAISLVEEPYYKRLEILRRIVDLHPELGRMLNVKQQRTVGNAAELYALHEDMLPGLDSDSIKESLGYEVDGLIYTPAEANYQNDQTYKYKRPRMMSVDFSVSFFGGKWQLSYWDHGKLVPFEGMGKLRFTPKMLDMSAATFPIQNEQIVEFVWNSRRGVLTPTRVRLDKSRPNNKIVVNDVWNDFMTPISEESLKGEDLTMYFRFHNEYKRMLLHQFINDSTKLVVDIGTGRGGDLGKWAHRPSTVNYIAIEPNNENFNELNNRLRTRHEIHISRSSQIDGDSTTQRFVIDRKHTELSVNITHPSTPVLRIVDDVLTAKLQDSVAFKARMTIDEIFTDILGAEARNGTYAVKFPKRAASKEWFVPVDVASLSYELADVMSKELVIKLDNAFESWTLSSFRQDSGKPELSEDLPTNFNGALAELMERFSITESEATRYITTIQLQHYNAVIATINKQINAASLARRVHPLMIGFQESDTLDELLKGITLRTPDDIDRRYEPNSVDLITSFFSFNYFFQSAEYFENFLKSVDRILRPGGRLVFLYLDGNALVKKMGSRSSIVRKLWSIKMLSERSDGSRLTGKDVEATNHFGIKILTTLNDNASMVHDVNEYLVFEDELEAGLARYGLNRSRYGNDYSQYSFLTHSPDEDRDFLNEEEMDLKRELDSEELAWRKEFNAIRQNQQHQNIEDTGIQYTVKVVDGVKRTVIKSVRETNPLFEFLTNSALPESSNELSSMYRVASYVKRIEYRSLDMVLRRIAYLKFQIELGYVENNVDLRTAYTAELGSHNSMIGAFRMLITDSEHVRLQAQLAESRRYYNASKRIFDQHELSKGYREMVNQLYYEPYLQLLESSKDIKASGLVPTLADPSIKSKGLKELQQLTKLPKLTLDDLRPFIAVMRNFICEAIGIDTKKDKETDAEFKKRFGVESTRFFAESTVIKEAYIAAEEQLTEDRMKLYMHLGKLMTIDGFTHGGRPGEEVLAECLGKIFTATTELTKLSDSYDVELKKIGFKEDWVSLFKPFHTGKINVTDMVERNRVRAIDLELRLKAFTSNLDASAVELRKQVAKYTYIVDNIIQEYTSTKFTPIGGYSLIAPRELVDLPEGAEIQKVMTPLDEEISYADTVLKKRSMQRMDKVVFLQKVRYQQLALQMYSTDANGQNHLYEIEVYTPVDKLKEPLQGIGASSDNVMTVPSILRRYKPEYFVSSNTNQSTPLASFMKPVQYFNKKTIETRARLLQMFPKEAALVRAASSNPVELELELVKARIKALYRSRADVIIRIFSAKISDLINSTRKESFDRRSRTIINISIQRLRNLYFSPNVVIDVDAIDKLKSKFLTIVASVAIEYDTDTVSTKIVRKFKDISIGDKKSDEYRTFQRIRREKFVELSGQTGKGTIEEINKANNLKFTDAVNKVNMYINSNAIEVYERIFGESSVERDFNYQLADNSKLLNQLSELYDTHPGANVADLALKELEIINTEIEYYSSTIPKKVLMDMMVGFSEGYFEGVVTQKDIDSGILSGMKEAIPEKRVVKESTIKLAPEKKRPGQRKVKSVIKIVNKSKIDIDESDTEADSLKESIKTVVPLVVKEGRIAKESMPKLLAVNAVAFLDKENGIVRIGSTGDGTCMAHSILRAVDKKSTDSAGMRDYWASVMTEEDLPELAAISLKKAKKLLQNHSEFLTSDFLKFLGTRYEVNIIVVVNKTGGGYHTSEYVDNGQATTIVLYNITKKGKEHKGIHFEVVGRWSAETKVVTMRFQKSDPFIVELIEEIETRERSVVDDAPVVSYMEAVYGNEGLLNTMIDAFGMKKSTIAKWREAGLETFGEMVVELATERGFSPVYVSMINEEGPSLQLEMKKKPEDGDAVMVFLKEQVKDTEKKKKILKYTHLLFDGEITSMWERVDMRVTSYGKRE